MKSKIKVMHFVSGFKNGGVEQFLLNYTSLLNKNCNIDEVIVYQHKADPEKLELSKKLGNHMYEIPFKKTHPLKNLIATYKIIKKERPDIIHAHMSLVNFFPLSVAKFLKVPVRISHSHIAKDNINPKLAPIFKKLNIKFSTNLVACGIQAGKYMYGDKDFDILYNAIDQNKYSFNESARVQIREKYHIKDNTMVLGHIGRCTEQKNQKFLIDIFSEYLKKNPNAILFIIGDGELSQSLDNYIDSKKITNKVIRIKHVRSTEKFYSAFDVFLLPSIYEGLPVVGIEAQASGVATLLSKNIDPTTIYTKNTKLLPINKGADIWIKNIKKVNNRRNMYSDNYNIFKAYKQLYLFYVKNLERNKKESNI